MKDKKTRATIAQDIKRSRPARLLALILLLPMLLAACSEGEQLDTLPSRHTVMMLMPWSTDLEPYFEQNLNDLARAVGEGLLKNDRIVVCIAPTPSQASLIELRAKGNRCVRDTIRRYSAPDFTSTAQLTQVLCDMRDRAPALSYSLIIGSHGMSWMPRGALSSYSRSVTRWFGGLTSDYQTETTALADALTAAGLHMEYIMFDDCFMSAVEVAYDLKDVTDHLIGCPTEIMIYGFPYHQCARHLVGQPDYEALCQTFIEFYSSYSTPCGTIAVTDCRQLDALAAVMRRINSSYLPDEAMADGLQSTDGFTPHIFFDLGDYAARLCRDEALLGEFSRQLEATVPWKGATEYYYSAATGYNKIETYSGITVSPPFRRALSLGVEQTRWYRDTH